MFRVVLIRSANNCLYNIWYLSHCYCYLPLSQKSWNWFECAVGGVHHPQHTQTKKKNQTTKFSHVYFYCPEVSRDPYILLPGSATCPIYFYCPEVLRVSYIFIVRMCHVSHIYLLPGNFTCPIYFYCPEVSRVPYIFIARTCHVSHIFLLPGRVTCPIYFYCQEVSRVSYIFQPLRFKYHKVRGLKFCIRVKSQLRTN